MWNFNATDFIFLSEIEEKLRSHTKPQKLKFEGD